MDTKIMNRSTFLKTLFGITLLPTILVRVVAKKPDTITIYPNPFSRDGSYPVIDFDEFVRVQPMANPSGQLFYLDYTDKPRNPNEQVITPIGRFPKKYE